MEEKEKIDEKYKIGQQILKHDDIHKKLVAKGETFEIKFPMPFVQERIERDIAVRLGGSPLDSFPQSSYNQIRMCVILDSVIVESPDWWTTAGECYDEDLLMQLWEKYLDEREKFRRSLREGKFKRNS